MDDWSLTHRIRRRKLLAVFGLLDAVVMLLIYPVQPNAVRHAER